MTHHPTDSEDIPTNQSHNEHFDAVVQRTLDRRGFMLKTGVGAAAVAFMSAGLTGCGGGDSATAPTAEPGRTVAPEPEQPLLGFTAIATYTDDGVSVAPGYTATPFLPWGTPLFATGAGSTWAGDASEDAAAQARQMGDNHDGLHFFAIDGKSDEGLLVMNHEYTNTEYLFANGVVDSEDDADKDLNAHGVSVVHIKRTAGVWAVQLDSAYNRRITGNTLMQLTGPAAGDTLLRTTADPTGTAVFGTLNNCGNGWTPWGTYLTCEENFNQYFGTTNTAVPGQTRNTSQTRYGLASGTTERHYETYFDRFDWQKEPNEANRFGWIVEIDPFDPSSTPKKRTALGRIKHENAAYAIAADGRVVIYMGDDQANDYVYKFVSSGRYIEGNLVNNRNLLDSGTLYVAKFNAGETTGDMMGTGEWLPMTTANPALAAFTTQAQILVNTRLAADALGATPMDRPEWVTVHPQTSEVYLTLTNNSSRSVINEANPRTANRYGQIVRWRETGGDAAALSFDWDLFVLAGNPTIEQTNALNAGSANVTAANTFNSPDGLGFDAAGRLWIQTDGSDANTGNYANQGNNQMLCADPVTKEIRRFFAGPKGCEVTGLTFTPDQRTLFVNIQHPDVSRWPEGGTALPRSATVIITKNDGGVIGT